MPTAANPPMTDFERDELAYFIANFEDVSSLEVDHPDELAVRVVLLNSLGLVWCAMRGIRVVPGYTGYDFNEMRHRLPDNVREWATSEWVARVRSPQGGRSSLHRAPGW